MTKRTKTIGAAILLVLLLAGTGVLALLRWVEGVVQADCAYTTTKMTSIVLLMYQEKHGGRFPDSLNDPEFLTCCSDEEFRCSVQDPRMVYHKPPPAAPRSFVVLELPTRRGKYVLDGDMQPKWVPAP